jgi:hypothetical protein
MTNRPPARLLDAQERRDVLTILGVGCPRTLAACYVGCRVGDIRHTAQQDAEFAEALRQAANRFELSQLKNLTAAAADARHWRAAAWALEHRFPSRWGRRPAGTLTAGECLQKLDDLAGMVCDAVADPELVRRVQRHLQMLKTSVRRLANRKTLPRTTS